MSFYTELSPFVEYLHSIRKLQNYLSFDMVFPTKWSLPKSIVDEGQIVGFEAENQNLKGISFVSLIDDSEVSKNLIKNHRDPIVDDLITLYEEANENGITTHSSGTNGKSKK